MNIIALMVIVSIFIFNRLTHKEFDFICYLLIIMIIIIGFQFLPIIDMGQGSDQAYAVFIIGTIFISIGYYITISQRGNGNYRILLKESRNYELKLNRNLNYKLLKVICIILIIFELSLYVEVLGYINSSYSLLYIRGQFTNLITNNDFKNYFHQYVLTPITELLPAIIIADLFFGKKDKLLLAISSVCIILYSLIDGSRYMYVYIIFQILVALVLHGKSLNISKKAKARMFASSIVIAVLTVSMVIYISNIRDSKYDFWETIYIYYAGCIPHMSIRLTDIDASGSFTYGFECVRGFTEPIRAIFKFLKLDDLIPRVVTEADIFFKSIDESISLGSISYNAFVTPFLFFYKDMGYIGVIIGSTIYGWIGGKAQNNLNSKINMYTVSYYLLIMETVILFMVRWNFSSYRFALALVYFFLLFRKQKG